MSRKGERTLSNSQGAKAESAGSKNIEANPTGLKRSMRGGRERDGKEAVGKYVREEEAAKRRERALLYNPAGGKTRMIGARLRTSGKTHDSSETNNDTGRFRPERRLVGMTSRQIKGAQ